MQSGVEDLTCCMSRVIHITLNLSHCQWRAVEQPLALCEQAPSGGGSKSHDHLSEIRYPVLTVISENSTA